jgi:hypothetical protein
VIFNKFVMSFKYATISEYMEENEDLFRCPCWGDCETVPPTCVSDCLYQTSKEWTRICKFHYEEDMEIANNPNSSLSPSEVKTKPNTPAIECDDCIADFKEKTRVVTAVTMYCDDNPEKLSRDCLCEQCQKDIVSCLYPNRNACLCCEPRSPYYVMDHTIDLVVCDKNCPYQLSRVYEVLYAAIDRLPPCEVWNWKYPYEDDEFYNK